MLQGRLWWEDAWVAFAAFFATAFSVSGELLFNPSTHCFLLRWPDPLLTFMLRYKKSVFADCG